VHFFCEGHRSRSYRRTAAIRLIVQPCDEDYSFFFIFPCNGAPVELNWQGKTEVLGGGGEKPVPVPLCPPQIPHGLTRDRTRASAVRGWRLTVWAMARHFMCIYYKHASIFVKINTLYDCAYSWQLVLYVFRSILTSSNNIWNANFKFLWSVSLHFMLCASLMHSKP
jgi:hypothetical protein